MRKILLTIVLLLLFFNSPYAQSPLQEVSKIYFRTHPFDSKFSSFILNLQKDPWLTIHEFNRRTDSSFFYISGTYKNFNPLRYTPTELKLIVAEDEIVYSDSLLTHDTIINLQLIGIIDTNIASAKLAEKEFKRFHQSQSKRFDDFTNKTLGGPNQKTGEINNYFVSPFSISPVTIAWGMMPETKQYTFAITIRFKVAENQALYIMQPGELKRL